MLSYRPIVARPTTPQSNATGPQDVPAGTPTRSVSGRPTSTSEIAAGSGLKCPPSRT